jgi:hypothetical protein
MTTYIYSKWKQATVGYPVEFYSELDQRRFETRKIEVFSDGRLGYASQEKSAHGTRLGIIAVPSLPELKLLNEFNTEEISKEKFDAKWKEAQ